MKDTTRNTYLAVDFGGGSGRVIAGSLLQGKLELEEIHRFTNRQVKLGNHVYWDFPALFEDMKTGLKLAVQKGYHVKGIGIDTWGVDFGLIDKKGNLLGNPVCYRDARTDGMPDKVFQNTGCTKALRLHRHTSNAYQYAVSALQHATESGRTVRSCTAASLYARPLQLLPDGSSQ